MSTKITPLGSAPTSVRAGVGVPVAVNWKDAGEPTVNVVVAALVIEGAVFVPPEPAVTTSVKAWLASGGTPVVAQSVNL